MKHKKIIFLLIVVMFIFFVLSSSFGVALYYLNITIVGNGTVNKDPNFVEFLPGETVTLTAVPDKGWKFIQWEGDLSGSENPESLTMDDDKDVTAIFKNVSSTATNLLILDNE